MIPVQYSKLQLCVASRSVPVGVGGGQGRELPEREGEKGEFRRPRLPPLFFFPPSTVLYKRSAADFRTRTHDVV
jgi:hypothetical protein